MDHAVAICNAAEAQCIKRVAMQDVARVQRLLAVHDARRTALQEHQFA